MRHSPTFLTVQVVFLACVLSSLPGCKPLVVTEEDRRWWEEVEVESTHGYVPIDGAIDDDDWVDFDDGGDYVDDEEDYYDGGY